MSLSRHTPVGATGAAILSGEVAAGFGHIRIRVCCAFRFRPLRPTHFGFGQSGQSHCSGFGPYGLPSFRRCSRGTRCKRPPGRNADSAPASSPPTQRLHSACTNVAFCGVCAICGEDQDQDQQLKLCFCFSSPMAQTPPIATLAQAECRRRGAGERGRTPSQRRWAMDGPSARPGGAAPE